MKKLSDDHYIVVDDSEVKQGVLFLMNGHIIRQCEYVDGYMVIDTTQGKHHVSVCKKITRSSQPMGTQIDGVNCWTSELMPLSLSEVKELLGVVNVEKKVMELYNNFKLKPFEAMYPLEGATKRFVENVYNQALEDNKERKYTEEDMRKAMRFGSMRNKLTISELESSFQQLIQSLQPKTEWNVEIVEDKLKLKL